MDFGITAPLTKTIQEMSNVGRASIIAKFLFHLLSSQQKTVLIIDEAQFLDIQSWTLVEKMGRRCSHVSILLSGNIPKLMNASHFKKLSKLTRFVNIKLQPLDPGEVLSLCVKKSRGSNWPDHVIQMICEQSNGHPKHCVALVETLLITKKVQKKEGGELVFADDELIRKTIFAHQANSQMAKVAAFDGLDQLSKYLVKIAAVFERHFTFDYLASILPFALKKEKGAVKAAWVSLCNNGWFQSDNFDDRKSDWLHDVNNAFGNLMQRGQFQTFSFSDSEVQRVVYDLIPEGTLRKELHLEAAHCLYNFLEDDLQSVFPLLCYHFQVGGDEEEELKMAQMSAAGFMREGSLEEAVIKWERVLLLSETSEFAMFEGFEKEEGVAGWCMCLAECHYVLGSFESCRREVLKALEWLKVDCNDGVGVEDVQKSICSLAKKHAWAVFKGSDKGEKINQKNDKLGTSTDVKALGRLFLLSAVDLDYEGYCRYGLALMERFVSQKTPQGNTMACFVSLLLQQVIENPGMVIKKAFNTLEKKAMSSYEETQNMFKVPTWAYLHSLSSIFYFGSDLVKSNKWALDGFNGFQLLSNTSGQIESLFCLCHCDHSMLNAGSDVRLQTLRGIGEAVKNRSAVIWWCTLAVGNYGSLVSQVAEAGDLERIRDVLLVLREINGDDASGRLEPLPTCFKISALASEAFASLVVGEVGCGQCAVDCAIKSLELMRKATLPVAFMKEAFITTAEVFLFLHKENQAIENR